MKMLNERRIRSIILYDEFTQSKNDSITSQASDECLAFPQGEAEHAFFRRRVNDLRHVN